MKRRTTGGAGGRMHSKLLKVLRQRIVKAAREVPVSVYQDIVNSAYDSALRVRNAVEGLAVKDNSGQSEGVGLTIGWGGLCLEHARCAIWQET